MQWFRRSWVNYSAVAVSGIMGAMFFWFWNSGKSPFFSTQPLMPLHPAATAMVAGFQGQPLTRIVSQDALVVDPSQLPTWALQELHRRDPKAMASKRQFLWNGHSSFFKKALQWNVSGLHPVHIHIVVPVKGVSEELIRVIAREHNDWTRQAWIWHHQGFGPPLKTVHVTMSPSLMQILSPWIPPGSSVSVINRQGSLLAQVANPISRGLSWQPHPAGEILSPVLLATALQHPQLFAKLRPTQSDLLNVISRRWGQSSIRGTLKSLRFGKGTAIRGQPFSDPPLPPSPVNVFSHATNLWVTNDEVARAYLVLANLGKEAPHLRWNAASARSSLKPITTREAVRKVEHVLPQELADNTRFYVWRPDNQMSVAYTHAKGGIVIVIQGSATLHTLSIAQQVALWAHNS